MEELLEKLEKGIPMKEVLVFQKNYSLTNKQMSYLLGISSQQYNRYVRLNKESLNRKLSGQFLKVQEVFLEGKVALMSKAAFLHWMQLAHWYFNQRKPFDLLDTPIGADAVMGELGRAKYGMLS